MTNYRMNPNKRREVMQFFTLAFICFAPQFLMGCSNKITSLFGASSGSGYVMLGPLQTSTVIAYPLLSTGLCDTENPISPATTTNSSGYYSLDLSSTTDPESPICIVATGGTNVDEATGSTVDLGTNTITAIVPTFQDLSSNITISPFTQMIASYIQLQVAAGLPDDKTLSSFIYDSTYMVSRTFGFDDVLGVAPNNPFEKITNTIGGQYAMALVSFSEAARQIGTDTVTLAKAYGPIFADSTFQSTGMLTSMPVNVTDLNGDSITLSPPLPGAINAILNSILSGTTKISEITPPSASKFPSLAMISQPPTSAVEGYSIGRMAGWATPITPVPTPGPATSISIIAPAYNKISDSFKVTVAALDQYGNLAKSYTGTVEFTAPTDSGAPTLPANYTFKTSDAGKHIFSDLQLDTLGSQTLTVTDTVTSSITGNTLIEITPDP